MATLPSELILYIFELSLPPPVLRDGLYIQRLAHALNLVLVSPELADAAKRLLYSVLRCERRIVGKARLFSTRPKGTELLRFADETRFELIRQMDCRSFNARPVLDLNTALGRAFLQGRFTSLTRLCFNDRVETPVLDAIRLLPEIKELLISDAVPSEAVEGATLPMLESLVCRDLIFHDEESTEHWINWLAESRFPRLSQITIHISPRDHNPRPLDRLFPVLNAIESQPTMLVPFYSKGHTSTVHLLDTTRTVYSLDSSQDLESDREGARLVTHIAFGFDLYFGSLEESGSLPSKLKTMPLLESMTVYRRDPDTIKQLEALCGKRNIRLYSRHSLTEEHEFLEKDECWKELGQQFRK